MSTKYPSRRAIVTAAALAPAITIAAAATDRDPIFAAIENHRQADAELIRAFEWRESLQEEVIRPLDWWYSSRFERTPPAGTTATNIEVEALVTKGYDAVREAAIALLTVRPSTISGVTALLHYGAKIDSTYFNPSDAIDEAHFHAALLRHVAAALDAIQESKRS